jgi:hypothetical protein
VPVASSKPANLGVSCLHRAFTRPSSRFLPVTQKFQSFEAFDIKK